MVSKSRVMVGCPIETHAILQAESARMLQSHIEGRSQLPDDVLLKAERNGSVPLGYVILKAMEELIDHRERSKRSSRRKADTRAGTPSDTQ